MRGFTTVRDLGGPAFGLKRAIDEGLVVGPCIYPSRAMITITSGRGDDAILPCICCMRFTSSEDEAWRARD